MKEYILSKPGLILMAIPSTMFFLIELDMIPYDNEELCCVILALCMIIVMVSAVIHCGWHGIWIGPLRIVIGITCGGLIVWSLFGLMATLILGAGGDSGATYHEIVGNGRRRHVHLTSGGNIWGVRYEDDYGEYYDAYSPSDTVVRDAYGNQYDLL